MNAKDRRYDVDWLRVFAMAMIFLFHCARFFDFGEWHVKNNRLNFGMTVFVGVVSQWIMPLFFVLSAISAYHALNSRNNGQYITERSGRLVVPLVFGVFVLVPPQVYIERVTHSQFAGPFFAFVPKYFDGFYGFGGNFAWMGLHLWYLEFLFIFSVITLPLFRYFRKKTMQDVLSKIAIFIEKPGAIFFLAIPVAIMELLVNLRPRGIGRRDFGGWSLPVYLVFFILGYVIASNELFKRTIEKGRIAALILGVIATTMGYILLRSGYSSFTPLFSLLRGFNSWFWLVAILGFGSALFNFTNNFLTYASEAVLPFYILHQTVIVIVGYFIIGWDAGVLVKYLTLGTVSFVLIIGLYVTIVRRISVFRFLFGMKSVVKR